jgi:hypothetical protein
MDAFSRNIGLEHAARMRDRRLRKKLLVTLFDLRVNPSGWTGAVTLRDAVDAAISEDQRFESELHCIGLCRDLSISGLAEERLSSRRRGDNFGLHRLEYRITAAGLALILESAAPNPLVDDDRL